jgi:hypothetical protein
VKYSRMVVKVQKPLMGAPDVLIYNEDKSVWALLPFEPRDIEALFGREVKQYWLADVPKKTGIIKLVKRVKEQDW